MHSFEKDSASSEGDGSDADSRRARAPFQPLDFLQWLARELSSPHLICLRARIEADGSISFAFRRPKMKPVLLRWTCKADASAAVSFPGIEGGFISTGLGPPEVDSVVESLRRVLREQEPALLGFGPPSDRTLEFSVESLGEVVATLLVLGRTRWGTFVLETIRQVSPLALEFCFASSDPDPVREVLVMLTPKNWEVDEAGELTFHAADLTFRYEADNRRPDERRELAFQVERLLGYTIARALAHDSPLRSPVPRLVDMLQDSRLPHELGEDILFRRWGQNYVSNEMVLYSRGFADFVIHGNRECCGAVARIFGKQETFNFSPWTVDIGETGHGFVTDLDDNTAVVGGEERLVAALDIIGQRGSPRPTFVAPLCDYGCLGDDVNGITKRASQKYDSAFVPMSEVRGPDHPLGPLDNRWNHTLESLLAGRLASTEQEPRSVNLVGLGPPDDRAVVEVARLLEDAGVQVNANLFPFLHDVDADSLARAATWVMTPWEPVLRGPGVFVKHNEREHLSLPAPYGLHGTKRWLDEVRKAVGLGPLESDAYAVLVGPAADELEQLRDGTVPTVEVGFVVPVLSVWELVTPRFFFGLEPLRFLEEIGIRTTIVATQVPQGAPIPSPQQIADRCKLVDAAMLRVVPQASGEPLVETLSRTTCDLVYTDHPHHTLVAAAGKMPFSICDFEPGVAGAVRTLRRLQKRAKNGFFKQYRGFLGQASS